MTRLRFTLESSSNDLQAAAEQLAAATCTNNVQGKVTMNVIVVV